MRGMRLLAGLLLVAAIPAVVRAHHSLATIETSRSLWIAGTVASFRAMHPHAMIEMDVAQPDGRIARWSVEGPNLSRLARMGADQSFLRAGDRIEVCAFAFRAGFPAGAGRNLVHGHALVMPDGRMRLFGPYGKLDRCIRPADAVDDWVRFLRSDPLGLQAWCSGLARGGAATSSAKTFVDAVHGALRGPCR